MCAVYLLMSVYIDCTLLRCLLSFRNFTEVAIEVVGLVVNRTIDPVQYSAHLCIIARSMQ